MAKLSRRTLFAAALLIVAIELGSFSLSQLIRKDTT